MPNTELVFSAFKPDVAKQGFAAVQSTIKIFESVPGCLSAKIGHVLRYQGRDVRTEYRGVLAIGTLLPLLPSSSSIYSHDCLRHGTSSNPLPFPSLRFTSPCHSTRHNHQNRTNINIKNGTTPPPSTPSTPPPPPSNPGSAP
ncbi:hypothetical protein P154DRAFT_247738 [Amniculicola lignicola CBS 123094]|uniref:Uncharacterized protein n=1 Tax=Amniculicola lignicola CBS 123094 TaxID=1392246 RepID=A0A6A5W980_9PLEO|nr:hypothetical protein P154DRAFT_247738 [Amniculicola lignicola CBS 123094]